MFFSKKTFSSNLHVSFSLYNMKILFVLNVRFLLAPMAQKAKNIKTIFLGACVIQNMMRTRFPRSSTKYADREHPETHEIIPGSWRDHECVTGLEALHGNNSTQADKAVRDYQRQYYTSQVGRVPWQDEMI